LDHAIVSPEGGGLQGVTDMALADLGLTRRVCVSVPHFLFLNAVLESTDLVAMAPWRLLRGNTALKIAEPPLDLPEFEMLMLWPERVHRDPAHQWLREQIARAVSAWGLRLRRRRVTQKARQPCAICAWLAACSAIRASLRASFLMVFT